MRLQTAAALILPRGYMPAGDIHMVIIPRNQAPGPWYAYTPDPFLETPEWIFKINQLKKWPRE
jgi:hypothetical protein